MIKFLQKCYALLIKKPLQRYNVENRAHKLIDSSKLPSHPEYLTTHDKIMKYIEDHPEIKDIVVSKPEQLIAMTKDFKIIAEEIKFIPKAKNLPTSRIKRQLYSVIEPEVIPPGRVSLQKVVEVITNYAENPNIPREDISSHLNHIPSEQIDNIIKYFKAFELYVPEKYSKLETLSYFENEKLKELDYPSISTVKKSIEETKKKLESPEIKTKKNDK